MSSLSSPEPIPSLEAVQQYLGTREQAHLCKDLTNCNTWPMEALLLQDLVTAYAHPEMRGQIEELRKLSRAISWFTYAPLNADELFSCFEKQLPQLEQDLPNLSKQDLELVRNALLAKETFGETLEPATQAMDRIFLAAWEALNGARKRADLNWQLLNKPSLIAGIEEKKALVGGLRPVRDALLFRRHFSGWLQT